MWLVNHVIKDKTNSWSLIVLCKKFEDMVRKEERMESWAHKEARKHYIRGLFWKAVNVEMKNLFQNVTALIERCSPCSYIVQCKLFRYNGRRLLSIDWRLTQLATSLIGAKLLVRTLKVLRPSWNRQADNLHRVIWILNIETIRLVYRKVINAVHLARLTYATFVFTDENICKRVNVVY